MFHLCPFLLGDSEALGGEWEGGVCVWGGAFAQIFHHHPSQLLTPLILPSDDWQYIICIDAILNFNIACQKVQNDRS